MRILRKDIYGKLPKLGATWANKNPMVLACFYDPFSSRRWFVLEFDGREVFFGFQVGDGRGLRYINLHELNGLPWPHHAKRNRKFKPCRLLELADY